MMYHKREVRKDKSSGTLRMSEFHMKFGGGYLLSVIQ
jgi:hypothetical protein